MMFIVCRLHTHGDSIEHAVYKTISDKVMTS